MIQSHLYTNKEGTKLFSSKGANSQLICVLGQNLWLGEIEKDGAWIHVLGIQGEGWVKAEDVESRSPLNLHVHWTPGHPIEYVSIAA